MTAIARLQAWYAGQCDEEWEHHYGISIISCDNPGWSVQIDLAGTPLSRCEFAAIRFGVDEDGHPNAPEWLCCHVSKNKWQGQAIYTSWSS
jgi:hypothetical protein